MRKPLFIILLAGLAFGYFGWSVELEVHRGIDYNVLTFGADSNATDGFDPFIDIAFFPPPTGGYGYFPINDSLYPGYTKLSVDIREPTKDTIVWNFAVGGGVGFIIKWNPYNLPDSGNYIIGAYTIDSLPDLVVTNWLDMKEHDSLSLDLLGGQINTSGSPISTIPQIPQPKQIEVKTYPNPFNSTINIALRGVGVTSPYGRSDKGQTGAKIFNIGGRLVADLPLPRTKSDEYSSLSGDRSADLVRGPTPLIWRPEKSVESGVYFIQIAYFGGNIVRRVIYVK